jgi:chromosome segregation ATPase
LGLSDVFALFQFDTLRATLLTEKERAALAEATVQALKDAMAVLEDNGAAAAKSIEDLQVRERKLKQLLAKQKAVIKSKADEAKASQGETHKALELSSELNARGDALRRATDDLAALQASWLQEASARSKAEGLLEAAEKNLASAEAAAAESAQRNVTSDAALADLRAQFDDYKRRAAAMLARGASSNEVVGASIQASSVDMAEFIAYKKRSSEALRQVQSRDMCSACCRPRLPPEYVYL